jgi:Ca2+-binding EF-hand superfamily protein
MKVHKLVVMTLVSGSLVAALGATDLTKKGPMDFEAYDSDKNGFISKTEFYDLRDKRMNEKAQQGMLMRNAGNAPTFEEFDTNGDNQLTKMELLEGQMKNMSEKKSQKGMNQGKGMGQGQGMGKGMNNPK